MSERVLERLRTVEEVYVFIIFLLISFLLDPDPHISIPNRIQESQSVPGLLETYLKN